MQKGITPGLYKNPLTFFFTNPWFVLLIHDRRFYLFSLRVHLLSRNTFLRHLPERLPPMTVR